MRKSIVLFLSLFLISVSDIYPQITLWKLEPGNTSSGIGANVGRSVSVFGGTSEIGSNVVTVGSTQYVYVYASNWVDGDSTKGFEIEVKTLHFQNLTISYSQSSDNINKNTIGPRNFKLQYSLKDKNYKNVPNSAVTIPGDTCFQSPATKTDLPLPEKCNDDTTVYLRWIMTSNTGVKGKTITEAGQSRLANIVISGQEVPYPVTDIILSNNTILPGFPAGTAVGTLTVKDFNYPDSVTYSLVSGEGDTNNSLFQVSGDQLQTAAPLDTGTYSVRIHAFDGTYSYEEAFTILCYQFAPTDITLSNNRAITADPPGTFIGSLTTTDPNNPPLTFTYSLVDGEGSTDNGLFAISGSSLLSNAVLTNGKYSIRINSNNGYKDYAEVFTILAIPPATIWNGAKITFTKADSVDWTLPENQDRITPIIWITRANEKSIFNIYSEAADTAADCFMSSPSISPEGTEWSFGTTADLSSLIFDTFLNENACEPEDAVGYDMVLHLIMENIYIDLKFLSWNTAGGGGFSYERTTNSPLPVRLTSFSASVANKKVILNWTTATEVNNYGFEIERKQKNWEKIGFVKGNGNSNSPKVYSFEDNSAVTGKYSYRLKQIDFDGKFEYSGVSDISISPSEFSLSQNYPNPCNPEAVINFSIPENVHVTLKVYDMIGREVSTLIDEKKEAGQYSVKFEAGNLASGIYLYKLTAGKASITRKMMLLR